MGVRGALETDGGASTTPVEARVAVAAAVVAAVGAAEVVAVNAAVAVAVEAAAEAKVEAAVKAAVLKFPGLPRPWPVAAAEAEYEVEALGRGRLAWAGRCVRSLNELFLSLLPPGST